MPKLTQRTNKQPHNSIMRSSSAAPCSIVTLPTQRKVSEEDMQSSHDVSSTSFPSEESLPQLQTLSRVKKCNIGGDCNHLTSLRVSSCEDVSLIPQQQQKRVNSFRLKRPAPSVCLVDLACESQKQQRLVSPDSVQSHFVTPRRGDDEDDSSHVWGHFIDTLSPDHYQDSDYWKTSFLPSCPSPFTLYMQKNDPYPKPEKRRRIQSPNKQPLKGFFLAVPSVDDTTNRLSSLSF